MPGLKSLPPAFVDVRAPEHARFDGLNAADVHLGRLASDGSRGSPRRVAASQ